MKYDFTSILNRKGKDAIALDLVGVPGSNYPAPREGFDVIPMWIADMNFPIAPPIQEAMIQRVSQETFGYYMPSDAYFDSIIRWHKLRNGVEDMTREHIGYESGVLGGVATALRVFCSMGDTVLLHSPTYVGFTGTLTNAGYKIIHSPMYTDADGIWRMDFEDMEKKIVENNIHTAIFCSPHNPTGRVWERWEIEKAMELYRKYDMNVISDEIWSDIIRPGCKHIPTQSVSQDAKMRTVAMYAPSKTFNLAGLIGAYHVIYNRNIRQRCEKEASLSHYNSQNVVSMHALIGAYSDGGHQWADELCEVIAGNVDYACDYIEKHFEGVTVSKPQGTYMIFIDCAQWLEKTGKTMDELMKAGWDVGVVWQDGRAFHGPTHIRMNLALPLSRVREAFERLDKYVFNG